MAISPHSVISDKAHLGKNVTIAPFCTIYEDVIIGDNTCIGPNVSIYPGTRMGNNCKIFSGAALGAIPQDLKFNGEYTTLEIGDNVVIREYCTLNRGTKYHYKTVVDDNALIMAYVHIAHDCIVGKNTILSNAVTLAGHVEIADYAIIGGMSAVHQFVKIGAHSMIGGGCLVRKDVPPFVRASREPVSYIGVNAIGLRRRGYEASQITRIQDIYRELFVNGSNVTNSMKRILDELPNSSERTLILDFVNGSERGIIRGLMTSLDQ
ncbi:MAG: acyl-ACP--UDP-N-acetylglucosamine O-acyltransferase [Saprospiraceae bacterium]